MKRILLLRHAKSSWENPGLSDHERPLAPRGVHAAGVLNGYLAAEGIRPDLVICSTAVRAQQTLELVRPALDGLPVLMEDGIYDADGPALIGRLRVLPDEVGSVLLIGHNPAFETAARMLADGSGDADALARMRSKYPTGALAVLVANTTERWAALAADCCALERFVRPRDLET